MIRGRWYRAAQAEIGAQYEGRFADALGTWDDEGPFFLNDDKAWYRIDPPTKLVNAPKFIRLA